MTGKFPVPSTLVISAPLTNANSESSTRAVTGVVGGHQTKVRTWLEAIGLYNRLYHEGNIVRVPA